MSQDERNVEVKKTMQSIHRADSRIKTLALFLAAFLLMVNLMALYLSYSSLDLVLQNQKRATDGRRQQLEDIRKQNEELSECVLEVLTQDKKYTGQCKK